MSAPAVRAAVPPVQNLIGATRSRSCRSITATRPARDPSGRVERSSDEVGIGLTALSAFHQRRASERGERLVDGVSNVDVGSNVTRCRRRRRVDPGIQDHHEAAAAEWPERRRRHQHRHEGGSRSSAARYDFSATIRSTRTRSGNRSSDVAIRAAPRACATRTGYTIGGPILPSRQKAFFFWSQEWRRVTRALVVDLYDHQSVVLTDPPDPELRRANRPRRHAVKLLALWPAPEPGHVAVHQHEPERQQHAPGSDPIDSTTSR